jgi:hypothetical protein
MKINKTLLVSTRGDHRKINENQQHILISARKYPYEKKRKSTNTIGFSKGVPFFVFS